MRTPVAIGIVGVGSWGMSVARLVDELPRAELRSVYDTSPQTQLRLRAMLGAPTVAPTIDDVLHNETVDAIVLGVPSSKRSELAKAVLQADKHLLVPPPLALRSDEAHALVELAAARQRRLTQACEFGFTPAAQMLRELLDDGQLGELYYIDIAHHDPRARMRERNVLWGLGYEQTALVSQLLDDEPVVVTARGESYAEPGIVDVVHASLRFATGISAYVHLSWLGPEHGHRLMAVGSERTVVIDGKAGERALTIHGNDGDIVTPRLPDETSLRLACSHFLGLVSARRYDAADARRAVHCVAVLEALQESLDRGVSVECGGARSDAAVLVLPSR